MPRPLILASASPTRLAMLRAAGLDVTPDPARIDESAIRTALAAEGATPRDMADLLAEMKARKTADRHPDTLVLGCDQILEFDGQAWAKPESPDDAIRQITTLSANTHLLLSALVLYDGTQPVWRHIGIARLTMRPLSPDWISAYVTRNWAEIRDSVGCYHIEGEGIRLFSALEGDYLAVPGLPMIPLLNYLTQRGFIDA
jgi:septum formation protein